jgi:hypothetical protein
MQLVIHCTVTVSQLSMDNARLDDTIYVHCEIWNIEKYKLNFTKQVDHTLFRITTSILLRAGFGTPATLMPVDPPLDQIASPPARPLPHILSYQGLILVSPRKNWEALRTSHDGVSVKC